MGLGREVTCLVEAHQGQKKNLLVRNHKARALILGMYKFFVFGEGEGLGSCYGLKDYTMEETSLIALHQMV